MKTSPDIYEVHIQSLPQVQEEIKNNTYQCVSCLAVSNGLQKKTLIDPLSRNYEHMAIVYTCEHCSNQALAVSEDFLGHGNSVELQEYHTVHAEWHNEFY